VPVKFTGVVRHSPLVWPFTVTAIVSASGVRWCTAVTFQWEKNVCAEVPQDSQVVTFLRAPAMHGTH
jgi:hypothetical protein